MQIVLYSDDINLLSYWEGALKKKKYRVVYEYDDVMKLEHSIIVLNVESIEKNLLETVKTLKDKENTLLLLHRTPSIETARLLLQTGAFGYGNALMREHFIVMAVETLAEKMVWLSPDLTSELIVRIPPMLDNNDRDSVLANLTKREKEVALLLKDGLTYNAIAKKLGITSRTVKAHAQSTYKKLNVNDRVGLALLLK